MKNNKGSVLIWVMLVMLVASIFIFASQLSMVRLTNRVAIENNQKQAYLTAKSACDAVASILLNYNKVENVTLKGQKELVDAVTTLPPNGEIKVDSIDFGTDEMGSVDVKIVPVAGQKNIYEIVAHSNVNGESYQMGLVLRYIKGAVNEGIALGVSKLDGKLGALTVQTGDLVTRGDFYPIGMGGDGLHVNNGSMYVGGNMDVTGNAIINIKNAFYCNGTVRVTHNVDFKVNGKNFSSGDQKSFIPFPFNPPPWAQNLADKTYQEFPKKGGVMEPGYYKVHSNQDMDFGNLLDNDPKTATVRSDAPVFIVVTGKVTITNNIPTLDVEKKKPDSRPRVYFILEKGAQLSFNNGDQFCVAVYGEDNTKVSISGAGCDIYGQIICGQFTNLNDGKKGKPTTLHLLPATGGDEQADTIDHFESIQYTQH